MDVDVGLAANVEGQISLMDMALGCFSDAKPFVAWNLFNGEVLARMKLMEVLVVVFVQALTLIAAKDLLGGGEFNSIPLILAMYHFDNLY